MILSQSQSGRAVFDELDRPIEARGRHHPPSPIFLLSFFDHKAILHFRDFIVLCLLISSKINTRLCINSLQYRQKEERRLIFHPIILNILFSKLNHLDISSFNIE
jgi:hypothetical protein